jgi:hypothetical protein
MIQTKAIRAYEDTKRRQWLAPVLWKDCGQWDQLGEWEHRVRSWNRKGAR